MTVVAVADVERSLAALWRASPHPDAHARLFTLVAVCASPDELARARGALPAVVSRYPSRTITVTCYPGEVPSVEARATLHVDTKRGNDPVGDDIDLDVRGDARAWVPATLGRLRAEDVPCYVWWVGDLPDDDRLFDHLLEMADVAVVNTSDMDLRDLEALARLIAYTQGAAVLADLTWVRLRAWQEFTARFFDEPAARGHLSRIREVTLRLCPRERELEATSTQAALFAAWLSVTLRWDLSSVAWSGEGTTRVATVRDSEGGDVQVRFTTLDRPGVYPGALDAVTLVTEGAHFDVHRSDDDPYVLCWESVAPELSVPAQCVRIGAPEEPKMLVRALERPRRDALFERAITAAAKLVNPVAARKT